jgi:hypothetical protein
MTTYDGDAFFYFFEISIFLIFQNLDFSIFQNFEKKIFFKKKKVDRHTSSSYVVTVIFQHQRKRNASTDPSTPIHVCIGTSASV